MLTGKLILTLQALTEAEWKELRLFLESSYHNRGKEATYSISMFSFLQKYAPALKTPELNSAALYNATFASTTVVPGKLEKMMGRLYQLTGKFISIQRQVYPEWLALAAFYRERNLPKLAVQQHDLGNTLLDKASSNDAESYLLRYKLQQEIVAYNNAYGQRPSDIGLLKALDALEVFHILSKLEYACWLHMQGINSDLRTTIAQSVPLRWLGVLSPSLAETHYVENPAIACYYAAYELLCNFLRPDRLLSERLESALNEYGGRLPSDIYQSLQTILRSHAVRQYNAGNAEYLSLAFRLYQQHIKEGWLYHGGRMLPDPILNIVTLGLRNKEAQWVYEFLQVHRHKIGGNFPTEEIYEYNMALYHFYCKDYETAGSLLSQDFQNFHYKIGARRLELMLYYEEQSVLLTSKIEAFKMFIFRLSKKQMPETLRQSNNHFIDFLRQIIHPSTLGNQRRIAKLTEKIKEKHWVAERHWLLEKLAENR